MELNNLELNALVIEVKEELKNILLYFEGEDNPSMELIIDVDKRLWQLYHKLPKLEAEKLLTTIEDIVKNNLLEEAAWQGRVMLLNDKMKISSTVEEIYSDIKNNIKFQQELLDMTDLEIVELVFNKYTGFYKVGKFWIPF